VKIPQAKIDRSLARARETEFSDRLDAADREGLSSKGDATARPSSERSCPKFQSRSLHEAATWGSFRLLGTARTDGGGRAGVLPETADLTRAVGAALPGR
jgi:hypothetical protein